MRQLKYENELFTPSEAAAMSLLSTQQQRDWRARGFLRDHEGHARLDVFEIAEMMAMKAFADQGRGPSLTKAIAPQIAEVIVWTALIWSTRAFSISPSTAYDRLPDYGANMTSDDEKLFWIVRDYFQQLGKVGNGSPHAIWWPTGFLELGNYSDLSSHGSAQGTESIPGDPRFDGPALVLPLDTAAANLARRAPRPFVKIM